ncbi:hypothetical protein [Fibrella aquatilis]|uniref:Glycerophosphoryl diester phosphodiesterase membrane domain-containing protein n=1 Tax=Fibrella aquatilis TaxID=2817059 RepID=A0A939GC13_9BACT|nr:hypothetical protein [Fibrella aquatilis]MBO0934080.1 hypothetical protein [Fibrella aquatilis]
MIDLQRERTFSEKINATFQYITANLGSLLRCLLYISGPLLLLGAISVGMIRGGVGGGSWVGVSMASVLSFFAYFFAFMVVPLVLSAHMKVYERENGGLVETSAVLAEVWASAGTTLLVNIVLFIMMVLVMLLSTMLVGFAVAAFRLINPYVASVLSLLFLLPVYATAAILSLTTPIIVFERGDVGHTIGRCFSLVGGKVLSTIGLVAVMLGVVYNLLMLLFIPYIAVMVIRPLVGFFEIPTFVTILFASFSVLAFSVIASIIIIAVNFQYFSLIERREHPGLIARIATIGMNTPVTPDAETY